MAGGGGELIWPLPHLFPLLLQYAIWKLYITCKVTWVHPMSIWCTITMVHSMAPVGKDQVWTTLKLILSCFHVNNDYAQNAPLVWEWEFGDSAESYPRRISVGLHFVVYDFNSCPKFHVSTEIIQLRKTSNSINTGLGARTTITHLRWEYFASFVMLVCEEVLFFSL